MNAKTPQNRNRPKSGPVSSPQRRSRGGMLLGLFIGVLLGLLCALGVVWYLHKTPLPFLEKSARPESGAEAAAAPGAPAAPQQLPGKPGDKVIEKPASDKPRFEFYKILPGTQEATPGNAKTPAAASAAAPATPGAPPTPATPQPAAAPAETFYLQAGAFQKAVDADNLKAKLALMGFETSVQEIATPDKGAMHRVRVGPYASPEEMNRARNQLVQNGIQAAPVKIRESAPVQPQH